MRVVGTHRHDPVGRRIVLAGLQHRLQDVVQADTARSAHAELVEGGRLVEDVVRREAGFVLQRACTLAEVFVHASLDFLHRVVSNMRNSARKTD